MIKWYRGLKITSEAFKVYIRAYIGLGFEAYGLGCRVQGCGLGLTVASVGYIRNTHRGCECRVYTKYA